MCKRVSNSWSCERFHHCPQSTHNGTALSLHTTRPRIYYLHSCHVMLIQGIFQFYLNHSHQLRPCIISSVNAPNNCDPQKTKTRCWTLMKLLWKLNHLNLWKILLLQDVNVSGPLSLFTCRSLVISHLYNHAWGYLLSQHLRILLYVAMKTSFL